ncbi:KR domain-containing protein [Sphingobacteriales bacterium UPWRP_1]|nr:hypothetical protein BVG80_15755 [Sphingobacteriales bacterium TSM_CSM]PSJ75038.1 KR domain-containing protein [Sphingobacteriales bacterium UPWRP_1]
MKLVIIIGAGPGISNGVAQKFGAEGYEIGLIARNEAKLQQQAEQLARQGIHARYATGNVADANSLKNALLTINPHFEQAGLILFNASAVSVKDLLEQDWQTIKQNFDVSVGGAFHLIQLVLPGMLQQNRGKLFFTGGGFAFSGDPQWTSLSIGKAGMRNLVQAAQKKVANTNIHIAQLTVCGYVQPTDPKYNPAAIANEYWKLFNQQPGQFEEEIVY